MHTTLLKNLSSQGAVVMIGMGKSNLSLAQELHPHVSCHVWDDNPHTQDQLRAMGFSLLDPQDPFSWKNVERLVVAPGISSAHPLVEKISTTLKLKPVCDVDLFMEAYPDLSIIAITGTAGKSTTTALIAHGLTQAGIAAVMAGNIGTPVWSLQEYATTSAVFVLELSSYQLDRLPHFYADSSVLLNIHPHHLDYHQGWKPYVNAKSRILKGQKLRHVLIHESFKDLLLQPLDPSITYSLLKEDGHDSYPTGTFLHPLTRQTAQILWSLYGLSQEQQRHAFATFTGLPHRQQQIFQGTFNQQPLIIINDSKATSPIACTLAIDLWFKRGYEVYWIGGGAWSPQQDWSCLKACMTSLSYASLMGPAGSAIRNFLTIPCDFSENLQDACAHMVHRCLHHPPERPRVILFSPGAPSFNEFAHFEARGEAFCKAMEPYFCALQ